jgi:SulP family sulfate permease
VALLPGLTAFRGYTAADLRGDLSAGLTVAVMLVPQGMAYAVLAGLPPVYGLYASCVPLVVYALLGTSRHLAVGPVAMVSLLVSVAVGPLAKPGSPEYLSLALLLALLAGGMQLALGLLRAGFVTNFFSEAVVGGFTSAAAVVIGVSQLRHLLGVPLPASDAVWEILAAALHRAGEAHAPTAAIAALSIAALALCRRWLPRVPGALLVVAATTLAVWALGLDHRGVAVVGPVPRGLPPFAVPPLQWDFVRTLAPDAGTASTPTGSFGPWASRTWQARFSAASRSRADFRARRSTTRRGPARGRPPSSRRGSLP